MRCKVVTQLFDYGKFAIADFASAADAREMSAFNSETYFFDCDSVIFDGITILKDGVFQKNVPFDSGWKGRVFCHRMRGGWSIKPLLSEKMCLLL